LKYGVYIVGSAERILARIEARQQDRLIAAIRALADTPRPSGVRKLTGRDSWRLRVGDYRIIYEVDDRRVTVTVIAIGHRRDVYR
jgi:mRNA interferase RelE/StbE